MATAFTRSGPFDGPEYTEDDWREWFAALLGVEAGVLNELAVTAGSGRQVLVDTGKTWVGGHHGTLDAQIPLALAANASGATRIDRIVARANYTADEVELDVVQGTPGGAAPTLTDNSSMKEVSLAKVSLANGYSNVTAGNITDERAFISPQGAAYADAAARDLWVPAPAAGMRAYLRDEDFIYTYNGTAWVGEFPKSRTIYVNPSAGDDDLTSATSATWPTVNTETVAVPDWATTALVRAKIGQASAVTGALNHSLFIGFGATAGDSHRIRWALGGGTEEHDINLEAQFDVTAFAGTSQAVRTRGSRVSGTGALRSDSESINTLDIEFLP